MAIDSHEREAAEKRIVKIQGMIDEMDATRDAATNPIDSTKILARAAIIRERAALVAAVSGQTS